MTETATRPEPLDAPRPTLAHIPALDGLQDKTYTASFGGGTNYLGTTTTGGLYW